LYIDANVRTSLDIWWKIWVPSSCLMCISRNYKTSYELECCWWNFFFLSFFTVGMCSLPLIKCTGICL
jgi:hypothetical protein